MSRGPALFTQASVIRAVRAARAVGADVEIQPDGKILIKTAERARRDNEAPDVDPDREIIL